MSDLIVSNIIYFQKQNNLLPQITSKYYSGISIKRTYYKVDTSIHRTVLREQIALLCSQTILEKICIKWLSL